VLSSLKGLPKDNSGYDLGQLFIGTEGTLGVITRACLKLHPKPRLEANAFLALPSLAAAQTLFLQLRSDLAGLLSAFEIIFPAVYEGVTGLCGQHPPVPAGAGMYALVEIQGQDESRDRERFETALMQACNEGLANDVVMSSASRDFKALWAIRDGISEFIFSLDSLTGFDIGVPLAGMQSFLDAASDAIAMIDPDAEFYIFGHLGDGNLHYIVKTANPDAVADVTFAEVARAGGTISAEHGIGLDKVKWLNRVRSDAEIAAMRRLKAAFDPNSILNPGRIFDVRSPLAHAGRI
jgi:FAD/FMN-containing dehydrogenase